MEQLHVAKFGGTSMADFQTMSRCADLVLSDPRIGLVVLSACSGITNKLVVLAGKDCSEEQRQTLLPEIYSHHRAVLSDITNDDRGVRNLEQLLFKLHDAVEQVKECYTGQRADEVLAFGERLSSFLFTELLIARSAEVTWFDATRVIATDNLYGNAHPDIPRIRELANELLLPLCQSSIVVTQGFIGAASNGNTTTLGRGGSDYSAALFAEALDAEAVQIWTDVDGIYTTDPRIAPKAFAIEEISFNEAAELATFGAKVLHPSTLLPAMRQNINVFVGSSFAPQSGGTWVKATADNCPNYRAIAQRNNQTLVTVTSIDMLHRHGFLAKVFNILAKHKISVDLVTTSEVSVALTLDNVGSKQAELTESALTELRELCEVKIEHDLALVAIVGNNIERQAGVSARIFGLMSPYNVRLICHGASSHNICFLVSQHEANDIVCSLHRDLFEQGQSS